MFDFSKIPIAFGMETQTCSSKFHNLSYPDFNVGHLYEFVVEFSNTLH